MVVADVRLEDPRDVRFKKLPCRIAIQHASLGFRVRTWHEGLEGWNQTWHLTLRGAERQRNRLVGEAVLDGYGMPTASAPEGRDA